MSTRLLLLWALLIPSALAAQTSRVVPVSGDVALSSDGGTSWSTLADEVEVGPDARVRTGADGFATITHGDGTEIVVRPSSEVEVGGVEERGVLVFIGKVLIRARRLLTSGGERAHRTVNTVAAIRGTEFGLAVDDSGRTRVFVFEGRVEVSNPSRPDSTVAVDAGRMTTVDRTQAPTTPRTFADGEFTGPGDGGLERGEDLAVEAGQAPVALRWLAFSDARLDLLRNPAFLPGAGNGLDVAGLGAFTGSTGEITRDGTPVPLRSDRMSRGFGQMIARGRFGAVSLGVTGQFDEGLDRGVTPRRGVGATTPDALWSSVDASAAEGRLLAGVRAGSGDFGLAIAHRSGTVEALEETTPGGDVVASATDTRITTASLGYRRPGLWDWGASVEHVRISEDRTADGDRELAGSGHRTAAEVIARRPVAGARLGIWLRADDQTLDETTRIRSAIDYREAIRIRTVRVGAGLGFAASDRARVGLDLALGLADESAIQRNVDGSLREDEEDLRLSASLHAGAQVRISHPLSVVVSVLHGSERTDRDFVYAEGSGVAPGTLRDLRNDGWTVAAAGLTWTRDAWRATWRVSGTGLPGRAVLQTLMLEWSPR